MLSFLPFCSFCCILSMLLVGVTHSVSHASNTRWEKREKVLSAWLHRHVSLLLVVFLFLMKNQDGNDTSPDSHAKENERDFSDVIRVTTILSEERERESLLVSLMPSLDVQVHLFWVSDTTREDIKRDSEATETREKKKAKPQTKLFNQRKNKEAGSCLTLIFLEALFAVFLMILFMEKLFLLTPWECSLFHRPSLLSFTPGGDSHLFLPSLIYGRQKRWTSFVGRERKSFVHNFYPPLVSHVTCFSHFLLLSSHLVLVPLTFRAGMSSKWWWDDHNHQLHSH